MRPLLVMDAKNYDDTLEEIVRYAVRAIIFVEDKLVMIESSFHEVKLPGGGIEEGETDLQALMREVKEETGYEVMKESVIPFGQIEEKRLSTQEEKIWHQISRLYFCDVLTERKECEYTESEKEYGFHLVYLTLEEAIAKNEQVLKEEGIQPWNQREYETLRLIRQHFDKKHEESERKSSE